MLDFRILGELDVRDGERRIEFREGNDASLLTLLLLHAGRPLSAERIVDELWPDNPPASARKIVQNSVSRLRRALGEERLETRGHGYVLHAAPEEIDAARFEELVTDGRGADALHLWRGPPALERDRFEELFLTALEQRLTADVDAGRSGTVAELETLVRRHPYRERLRALQMRALYVEGRQADALDAYRAAARTLREDLGLEPGPELRELEQAILRQDVAAPRHRPSERRRSRRRLVVATVVALAAAVALAVVLRPDAGSPADVVVVRNSVAVIDPASGRIVGDVRVGAQPRGVAVGAGGVWVANTGDETVTGIDPQTLQPFKTYGVDGAALDIAIRDGTLWVALDGAKAVARIDTRSQAVQTFSVPGNASVYAVDVGSDSVWVGAATVYRLDPRSGAIVQKPPSDCCVPIDLVVTPHSIWTNAFQNAVRLSLGTLREQVAVQLNSLEDHFAYGDGAVWVCASRFVGGRVQSNVWKLDDVSGATQAQTRVGDYATAIAAGEGAIWVASYNARTVSKLDPATGRVLDTIPVGGHPDGIAAGGGRVWVSVD